MILVRLDYKYFVFFFYTLYAKKNFTDFSVSSLKLSIVSFYISIENFTGIVEQSYNYYAKYLFHFQIGN